MHHWFLSTYFCFPLLIHWHAANLFPISYLFFYSDSCLSESIVELDSVLGYGLSSFDEKVELFWQIVIKVKGAHLKLFLILFFPPSVFYYMWLSLFNTKTAKLLGISFWVVGFVALPFTKCCILLASLKSFQEMEIFLGINAFWEFLGWGFFLI